MYIFGGMGEPYEQTIWRLDQETWQLKKLPKTMKRPRYCHSVCLNGNFCYIIGSRQPEASYTIERFLIKDQYCDPFCTSDYGRYYASAIGMNDFVYIFGGYLTEGNKLTNLIERVDVNKPYTEKPQAIQISEDMLPARYGMGIWKRDDCILLLGGHS